MALTNYEIQKRWIAKPGNREKRSTFMRDQRKYYRRLFLEGKIEYQNIPKGYRYFVNRRKRKADNS